MRLDQGQFRWHFYAFIVFEQNNRSKENGEVKEAREIHGSDPMGFRQ